VSYLFAGSQESALRDMATLQRSPFYKFGRIMALGPIPANEFAAFLEARFRRGRLRAGRDLLDAILATADDIPYNVQRLCHQLWAMRAGSADRLTEADLAAAVAAVVEQDTPHFSGTWERLSLHQRQVLQAIARSGGRNVFSAVFLQAHRLGPPSSVQTSLRLLLKGQLLSRTDGEYRITDPFLREWIAARSL
jgi:hypothetical protein